MTKSLTNTPSNALSRIGRIGLLGAALVSITACNTLNGNQEQAEGIGYRTARYEEITAMREYRECSAQAIQLDDQARMTKSAAKYLASANLITKCEASLGPEAADVAVEERMRTYGLSIQNYLKGGDIVQARANLQQFEQAFPNKDLYFADGTSFTESMGALLGQENEASMGKYSILNVNNDLKSEMRRVNYWKNN